LVLSLGFLALLLIFSAFFSGSEIAFMSLSDLKIRHLVDKKIRNASLLSKLKSDPNKLLITVLIGNNLANVGSASIATTLSISFLQDLGFASAFNYGVGLTTGVMTILILIFGEIAPKTYCVHHAERVALTIAPIVKFFQLLFYPIYFVLNFLLKSTSGDLLSNRYPKITEDEVITIVNIGEEEGAIQEEEKEMIHNIFEFDKIDVGSVMTPRVDMFTLKDSIEISKAVKKVKTLEFSRIPVYSDRIDKISGIVYTKDILKAEIAGKGKK